MKTARILLYPDEIQEETLRKMSERYCSLLVAWIENEIDFNDEYHRLSPSTIVQLERDVWRIRKRAKSNWYPRIEYCRWGDDYQLSERFLTLPINQDEILLIACVIRPFQKRMLEGKHPPTCTLKKMRKHWFAYLLVEEDKIS